MTPKDEETLLMNEANMYKRVLLCDKTLVSLDYVRNLESEPRPFMHPLAVHKLKISGSNDAAQSHPSGPIMDEVFDDITDNLIDLDGHHSTVIDSYSELSNATGVGSNVTRTTGGHHKRDSMQSLRMTTGGDLGSTNSSTIVASLSSTSNTNPPNQSLASSETVIDRRDDALSGTGRSLLNDDDPLVRCDMWDLEKGLKSRKPPENLLRIAVKTDFDTVRDAINRCRQLSEKTLPPEDEYRDGLEIMSTEDLMSLFSMKRGLIPGTKWCGLGDQASSYNDLGPKHRIDICCRAHDHCPIRSKPFRNDYGILNIGLYTKSHCDCDADFYRCLRGVRSRTADMLGNLYFNLMKLQCMKEERLKVCREVKPIALGFERCIRYEESPMKRVFKFTTPPVAY